MATKEERKNDKEYRNDRKRAIIFVATNTHLTLKSIGQLFEMTSQNICYILRHAGFTRYEEGQGRFQSPVIHKKKLIVRRT